MKNLYILVLTVIGSLSFLLGCSDAENLNSQKKELELQKKELELKEKEIAQSMQSNNTNQKVQSPSGKSQKQVEFKTKNWYSSQDQYLLKIENKNDKYLVAFKEKHEIEGLDYVLLASGKGRIKDGKLIFNDAGEYSFTIDDKGRGVLVTSSNDKIFFNKSIE